MSIASYTTESLQKKSPWPDGQYIQCGENHLGGQSLGMLLVDYHDQVNSSEMIYGYG